LPLTATSEGDVLLTLILAAVTIAAIRVLAANQVKSLLARGWLTNHGSVEFGSVEEHRVRYFSYYIARLDYSYSVNGEYYSGDLQELFLRERSADKFVDTMKGQMVFVRSHPSRPERSALLKQDQPGGWPL
jgi:hypothetical protein